MNMLKAQSKIERAEWPVNTCKPVVFQIEQYLLASYRHAPSEQARYIQRFYGANEIRSEMHD